MPSSFTLGTHFEGFIKQQVNTGRYASASEVVRDSLRLLEDREQLREMKLTELRAAMQVGLNSGASEPLDIAEIKTAGRELLRAQQAHGSNDQ